MEFDEYVIDLNAKCTCGCMEGDRFHNIYRFPNNYGASVVSSPKNDPKRKGGYRIMLIRFDSPAPEHMWTLDDDNPISDSILDCDDWETALAYLRRLFALPTHLNDG
ncbi:MAG: hypothetical protein E4H30_00595 [Methanomassiliicoccus sp.]|nr:MAG: hypothetical protein E4H30_00595 [Methanomassiliicoccus sp.]